MATPKQMLQRLLTTLAQLKAVIQDYFEYIFKKHETVTKSSLIRTYVNKIEHKIAFVIKAGYYLKLLTPETMKLLRSTKKITKVDKIIKDENGENVPYL